MLGMLLPCHDEVQRASQGGGNIPLGHRNRMMELTVMQHDWIDICPWGCSNEGRARVRIEELLRESFVGHHFRTYRVVDTDTAVAENLLFTGRHVVCVGNTSSTLELRIHQKKAESRAEVLKQVVLTSATFYLVNTEVDNVRPAEVRARLAVGEWGQLAEEGILPHEVVHYFHSAVKRSRSPWRRSYQTSCDTSPLVLPRPRRNLPLISSERSDANPLSSPALHFWRQQPSSS